jgi:hypothetical protein
MIVTKKNECIDLSTNDEHQTFTALDQYIEVKLSKNGEEWTSLTDKLQRGKY